MFHSFVVLSLGLLLFGSTNQAMASNNFVPLALGPDFNYPISADDILRGYKINTAQGESNLKQHIFTGEVIPIPYTDTFAKSAIIKSTEELNDMLEISGTLGVSYGPAISGEGSGRYLDTKVASRRQATILYRTRRAAYARAVNVATLQPVEEFNLLTPDETGTKFIDRIVYGAQLDVLFKVTATEDIDIQEIEAELKGKIGVGALSVEFEAKFEKKEGEASSTYTLEIEASATGVDFSIPPNPSFNETNKLINSFNAEYDQLREAVGSGSTVDVQTNVLRQLSPIGFSLASIADHTTLVNEMETATLDARMQELSGVFYSALFWKSQIQVSIDTQEMLYADPRERDEIFAPYKQIALIFIDNLDNKVDECLAFRRQPFDNLVGRNGAELTALPEYFPSSAKDVQIAQGLQGEAYLKSPVTIGSTEFSEHHYIGFALPVPDGANGFLTPWMSGWVRRDSDNYALAYARTPQELEQFAHAAVNDIEYRAHDYIKYDDTIHLQNNVMNSRWLSGARDGGDRVIARNKLQSEQESSELGWTYEWKVKSNPANDANALSGDPRAGQCLRYGDVMYLQVDPARWLSGERIHPSWASSNGSETNLARGGTGGSDFSRVNMDPGTSIQLRTGSRVDAIILNGSRHGGTGGSLSNNLVLQEGEFVNSFEIRSGSRVDNIRFWTNYGRTVGGGGGGGSYIRRDNIEVTGIAGKAGSEIDRIVIYFKPRGNMALTKNMFDSSEVDKRLNYEWIVRSVLGSGSRDASENADPAEGECVQTLGTLYLQNNEKDNRWLAGARPRVPGNEEVLTLNALRSETEQSDEFAPSYQWIVRKSSGNGGRSAGFFCGATSAKGKWVPITTDAGESGRTVTFVEGIVGREDASSPYWTKSDSWKDSAVHSVTGGFLFGDLELSVPWLTASEMYTSTKDAVEADSAMPQTIPFGTGQAWQFVYEVGDICDPVWDLLTADVVATGSLDEIPCCVPGFEVDPSNPHGPCRLSTPCQCNETVCQVAALQFDMPERFERIEDSNGEEPNGSGDEAGTDGVRNNDIGSDSSNRELAAVFIAGMVSILIILFS